MITFNGQKKHIKGMSQGIRKIILRIINDHQFHLSQIDYIFVNDEELLEINRSVLKHDYYTDIISFDYTENKIIEGEIYISVDRVKENAAKYEEKFHVELLRVMFHGILHYVGYKDKTKKDAEKMRDMENIYLKLYKKEFHVEQI